MRYQWLDEYLLQKRGVTKDFQPVWNWMRYHIGGKMFAAICLDKEGKPYYINLKLDPMEGEFLRGEYEDILPGYYSDKRWWNSVRPDGEVPDDLLREMLDKSYDLVLGGLSKKAQRLALGLTVCGQACGECPFYQKDCAGCNESGGKVFHAPEGKACPIYACAANRKRLTHCGFCGEVPCKLWRETKDPALSDQEFEQDLVNRLNQLQEVTPHGV